MEICTHDEIVLRFGFLSEEELKGVDSSVKKREESVYGVFMVYETDSIFKCK